MSTDPASLLLNLPPAGHQQNNDEEMNLRQRSLSSSGKNCRAVTNKFNNGCTANTAHQHGGKTPATSRRRLSSSAAVATPDLIRDILVATSPGSAWCRSRNGTEADGKYMAKLTSSVGALNNLNVRHIFLPSVKNLLRNMKFRYANPFVILTFSGVSALSPDLVIVQCAYPYIFILRVSSDRFL